MADTEFEQFRYYFGRLLPQHVNTPVSNYTLVHDVTPDDDDPPSDDDGSCSSNRGRIVNAANEIATPSVVDNKKRPNNCTTEVKNVAKKSSVRVMLDSEEEEEDVLVLDRHQYHEAHCGDNNCSADDCDECDQLCCSSVIADTDFSLFNGLTMSRSSPTAVCANNNNNTCSIISNSSSSSSSSSSRSSSSGESTSGRDSAVSELGFDSCSSSVNSCWPTPEHRPKTLLAPSDGHRRRRRLPEIPIKKKTLPTKSSPSLAEELDAAAQAALANATITADHRAQTTPSTTETSTTTTTTTILKRHRAVGNLSLSLRQSNQNRRENYVGNSPEIATDSGIYSTVHSPVAATTVTTATTNDEIDVESLCASSNRQTSSSSNASIYPQLELLEATHRGLHKFVPRHGDELEIEIGDPIYVQKESEDSWCEGVNLRSGRQGIFPSVYAVDLDYSDFDPTEPKFKKERYLLGYLGSVEAMSHKGTGVVCQAVRKIVGSSIDDGDDGLGGVDNRQSTRSPVSQTCVLEISDQGLRMVDRSKPRKNTGPCHDYFYSLKNVSFCAFHPKDHRYLGFITKHPTLQRFACHVFVGQESTRPVAEAVGRAFHRFYAKFIDTAFPIEDIYIE